MYTPKVFIINGKAGVGKDTFIDLFPDGCGVYNFSSIDPIKEIAEKYFGYDNTIKSDKDRKFLSDLKALTTEYCDYSMRATKDAFMDFIDSTNMPCHWRNSVMFIHIREPKEIDRCKQILHDLKCADVYTLQITSSRSIHSVINNASDLNTDNYKYDITIDNSGTIEDLKVKVNDFIKKFEIRIDD